MKAYRQYAAYSRSDDAQRISGFLWFLAFAIAIGSILLVASARAEQLTPMPLDRMDITLRADKLPAADAARLQARREAIDIALQSKSRLLRSWDSREVLAETIQILENHGADLGDTAIVNFVSMEFTAPASARQAIESLPFVRRLSEPSLPIPASYPDPNSDSEWGGVPPSLDFYRSREQGHRGEGVLVAIIDYEWGLLDTIPTLDPDQLPVIPSENRFKQRQASGSLFYDGLLGNVNEMGTREHGTAMLESHLEIAPDSEVLLYGIKGIAGIAAGIYDAVDRGADIIAVALTSMETMSDPVAIENGGTNRFTTPIDYATAAGTLVVVSAGNEATRSYKDTFRPCDECTPEDGPDNGVCLDANDDTNFHTFEADPTFMIPLLSATEPWDFESGYYDVASFTVTCMTAIEEMEGVDPNDYKFRIYRVGWETPPCDNDTNNPCDWPAFCPSDRASDPAVLSKNMGVTVNFQASFEVDEAYTIGVYRTSTADPTLFPEFRVMCARASSSPCSTLTGMSHNPTA